MNTAGRERIVVLDTDVPYELRNKFFDTSVTRDNRFLWPWAHLYQEALKRRIRFMTPDIYFALANKPKQAVFVSAHMIGRYTFPLRKAGVWPAVVFAYENPLFACRFYFNLKRYAGMYDHAYVYSGAKTMLPPRVTFHDAAFHPHAYARRSKGLDFSERKFLIMVNRNNRLHPLRKVYVRVMNRLKPLPSLSERDLYHDRLMALDYFSRNSSIDLYGEGWDRPARAGSASAPDIRRVYRGYVPDKLRTLMEYRFAICFENAVMNGFVTEKIIDCLFAGCIPVYFGAPDIKEYIPGGAFIDFRDFRGYTELDHYLRSMSVVEYERYLEAIDRFIASEEQKRFTQRYFADELLGILERYF